MLFQLFLLIDRDSIVKQLTFTTVAPMITLLCVMWIAALSHLESVRRGGLAQIFFWSELEMLVVVILIFLGGKFVSTSDDPYIDSI